MSFRYHVEPIPSALLLFGVWLVLGLIISQPIVRFICFVTAGGPLVWALIQIRRRGMSIDVGDAHLLVRRSISGRKVHIEYGAIGGCAATRRGGLALAYRELPGPLSPIEREHANREKQLALMDARPEPPPPSPRPRFVLTARVDDITQLVEVIESRRAAAQESEALLSPEEMRRLAARRRLRDFLIALILVLCTPLYAMFIGRLLIGL